MGEMRKEVERAISIRDEVRLHSGDAVDLKLYEPAVRHLIDTYIRADDSKTISHLDDISLIDLVLSKGADAANDLPAGTNRNRNNVAEAIENNVRRLIIDETPVNPRFYEQMSQLLTDLVTQRRNDAIEYAEYLKRIAELVKQAKSGHGADYPASIKSAGQKALFDNLNTDEELALRVDQAVRDVAPDGWRGHMMKEKKVRRAVETELPGAETLVDSIMAILKNHSEY
ncbi:hypothetical protein JWJ88_04480 [Paracoccus methylovorus]|uniref:DUF3387 domain-containing protein n=1 Tax=Paracoccus methylovorus TaxID=2812658 RepID=A0ABX7JI67_9RHOB|nr:hypothetical protein [Paracoccus methylovorus]QRZ13922.1 hypothetical protein JWJ88_04480 [Paracoccus methylovorus]